MNLLQQIESEIVNGRTPNFRIGDDVRVHVKIKDGDKSRTQIFEGTVIARKGAGAGATFTVRKTSFGVGVERIFPLLAPIVEKIEVRTRHQVRRSKLYFLRGLAGKAARLKEAARV
jgi:large subunit ribosomal protein L19